MKVTVLYPGSVLDRNGAAKVVRVFADKVASLNHLSGHEVNVIDSTSSSKIIQATHFLHDNDASTRYVLLKLLKGTI